MDPGGGLRGLKPPYIFSDTFFYWWFPTEKRPLGRFFVWPLINHFLHRDRDGNIKCKAYFAEFAQSECVYFQDK